MTRLERISRPVVGTELAKWIGQVARTQLQGQIKANRLLSCRLVTPLELKATPDLRPEDVEDLKAWFARYRKQRPTVEDVPVIGAYPRRPGVLVLDLGRSQELIDDRAFVLAGIGEVLWTNIRQSRDVQPGIIVAQMIDPQRNDNQEIARTVSMAMTELPAAVTLGEPQAAVRTDRGVIEL